MELKLARNVKNNKKGFFDYIIRKRKARDNVGPLLIETGVLLDGGCREGRATECLLCFSLQCQVRPSGIPGAGGKRVSLQRR